MTSKKQIPTFEKTIELIYGNVMMPSTKNITTTDAMAKFNNAKTEILNSYIDKSTIDTYVETIKTNIGSGDNSDYPTSDEIENLFTENSKNITQNISYNLIDFIYPIGSMYITSNSATTSMPFNLFTGTTWEFIKTDFDKELYYYKRTG